MSQEQNESTRNAEINATQANTANVQNVTLTDLEPAEQTEDQIKGGMLLPAVQKVREAAAR